MTTLGGSAMQTERSADLEFSRSRWASMRERNVKAVALEWTARPNLVEVLEDPRLGEAELVMLRKDRFEELISALGSMSRTRRSAQFDAKQLSRLTMVLLSMVKGDPESPMALLAKTAAEMAWQLMSQLGSDGTVSQLEPSTLTEEEGEFVQEQERLDRGGS